MEIIRREPQCMNGMVVKKRELKHINKHVFLFSFVWFRGTVYRFGSFFWSLNDEIFRVMSLMSIEMIFDFFFFVCHVPAFRLSNKSLLFALTHNVCVWFADDFSTDDYVLRRKTDRWIVLWLHFNIILDEWKWRIHHFVFTTKGNHKKMKLFSHIFRVRWN